jgi:trans-2,3-dihydro-3-hydroxyanthranilate isomerase
VSERQQPEPAALSASVSQSLPYAVIDVFTDKPFSGNPLAVVLDAEGLSTEQMQQIAGEFNLSETAFPLRPTDDERSEGADYTLRIFTPDVELPFAGHPSVGSAWWLAQLGRIERGVVHQRCGAGLLPIDVDEQSARLTGGAASVSEPIAARPALAAVGLDHADLVDREVRIASAGLAYAIVFVTPEAIARCRPDVSVLRESFSYPSPATGVYVVAWDGVERHARARMFAGDIGTPEDPATGSAALALGALLVARGECADGVTTFTVEQGVDMGRASRLEITCDVASGTATSLQVSGKAVLIAEGHIAVPE